MEIRDPRSVIIVSGRAAEMGTTVRDPEARVEIGRVAMGDDLTPVQWSVAVKWPFA